MLSSETVTQKCSVKNLLLKLQQKSLKLIINIYFVSNDAFLKFQGHLRIICYKLFGALR